jgi:hypothetical protein
MLTYIQNHPLGGGVVSPTGLLAPLTVALP